MLSWVKRLFCYNHEWECIPNVWSKMPLRFKCKKCGKEEGL